jgi:protein TonB
MTENVTDIIVARSRSNERLNAMIVWSLGLHAAVIAGILLAPAAKEDDTRPVMSISLSGSEGPRTEGLTQAGAQPVREVAPPQAKPVPVTPPKERPEMTLPDPKARTAPPRARPQAAEAPAPATPATAPSPTRVRGQGFGLSTSGGGGLGGVQVEASNFCCPDYLTLMVATIKTKWNSQQSVVGTTGMKFTIMRDGRITAVQIEKPSGFAVLDNESQHALLATERLQPLPPAYPNQTLTVHLLFDY